ncbi:hypothetical protein DEO72_LG7g784 [Vigna unguiculata]|uniref:Uncharacterized protein n=1 Tax=Vigna unguiculata TaxID=3917 RepID=A0A4D6MDH9_VIGUN|nr:hypothetical protein DEO72_LG7g784 [Vigna unguiculata]
MDSVKQDYEQDRLVGWTVSEEGLFKVPKTSSIALLVWCLTVQGEAPSGRHLKQWQWSLNLSGAWQAVVVANFLRQQSSVKLGRHVKFMNSCHMKHGPLVKFLPLDNFIWCIVILKLAGLQVPNRLLGQQLDSVLAIYAFGRIGAINWCALGSYDTAQRPCFPAFDALRTRTLVESVYEAVSNTLL